MAERDLGPLVDRPRASATTIFTRFKDATTFRGSVLARRSGSGVSLAGTYGEGIAQPTFFDLYGFFPGSFVGNPGLKPERAAAAKLALRYRDERVRRAR